jgi:hypothetical protein
MKIITLITQVPCSHFYEDFSTCIKCEAAKHTAREELFRLSLTLPPVGG